MRQRTLNNFTDRFNACPLAENIKVAPAGFSDIAVRVFLTGREATETAMLALTQLARETIRFGQTVFGKRASMASRQRECGNVGRKFGIPKSE
jgi:hypothetical protein